MYRRIYTDAVVARGIFRTIAYPDIVECGMWLLGDPVFVTGMSVALLQRRSLSNAIILRSHAVKVSKRKYAIDIVRKLSVSDSRTAKSDQSSARCTESLRKGCTSKNC